MFETLIWEFNLFSSLKSFHVVVLLLKLQINRASKKDSSFFRKLFVKLSAGIVQRIRHRFCVNRSGICLRAKQSSQFSNTELTNTKQIVDPMSFNAITSNLINKEWFGVN